MLANIDEIFAKKTRVTGFMYIFLLRPTKNVMHGSNLSLGISEMDNNHGFSQDEVNRRIDLNYF